MVLSIVIYFQAIPQNYTKSALNLYVLLDIPPRFLEKRMEGIHRYLEEHRTRIRLVLGIVLAAGKTCNTGL